jgi:hypothetical protein
MLDMQLVPSWRWAHLGTVPRGWVASRAAATAFAMPTTIHLLNEVPGVPGDVLGSVGVTRGGYRLCQAG